MNLSDGLSSQDDTFLSGDGNLTGADVGAPFLGPAFRIQTDLRVDAASPSSVGASQLHPRPTCATPTDLLLAGGGTDGEWASLRHANWLLNRRFGPRSRGYLAHIPKTMSAPVLHEIGRIWHAELLEVRKMPFLVAAAAGPDDAFPCRRPRLAFAVGAPNTSSPSS